MMEERNGGRIGEREGEVGGRMGQREDLRGRHMRQRKSVGEGCEQYAKVESVGLALSAALL